MKFFVTKIFLFIFNNISNKGNKLPIPPNVIIFLFNLELILLPLKNISSLKSQLLLE